MQEARFQTCKFRGVRTGRPQVCSPSTELERKGRKERLGEPRKEISAVTSSSAAAFARVLFRHRGLMGDQADEDWRTWVVSIALQSREAWVKSQYMMSR